MKISYNPITAEALTTAPANNDITFDLKGLNIFVRGVKFKGTDTTYSVFKKHTSSSGGGYNGLVPVPSYTSTNTRFLREDGTWLNITMSLYYYTLLTDENLNDYKTEGRWYYMGGSNTVTNGPSGINGGGELYVGRNASGYRYLKIILASGYIWFRIWNNETWGSWTRWYTDANTDSKVLLSSTTTANFRPVILGYNNDTSTSGLSASVTNQVYTTTTIYALPSTGSLWANKLYSGGKQVITEHQSLSNYVTINTNQTITGAKIFSTLLTANRIKITNTEAVKHIEFSRSGYNYITTPSGGTIAFDVTGNTVAGANCDLVISNGVVFPGTTNATTLGNSTYRWSNVYSVLGNFSGSVTSNGFNKSGSSNSYVLLGGGGHKALSDFALSTLLNDYVTTNTALTITGVKTFSTLLKFTVAGGTAPFTVTSSTVVTNLNADLLDGNHVTNLLRKVSVANNTTNDFNTFQNMTLTGRGDPVSGANLVNAPWSGQGPAGGYGVLTYLWSIYGILLAFGYNSNIMYIRNKYYLSSSGSSVWSTAWSTVALTTSNVASATKLLTARTIWGQSFDGTANVSGALTGATTINASDMITGKSYITTYGTGNRRMKLDSNGLWFYSSIGGWANGLYICDNSGTYLNQDICGLYGNASNIDYVYFGGTYNSPRMIIKTSTGNVGIGITVPSYKLHVAGNIYATAANVYASNIEAYNGYLKSICNGKTITIYSQNTGFCHYTTDAPKHWFNTSVDVQGNLTQYHPNNTPTYTCGTSLSRWLNVYSVSGNFSGTVTAASFSGNATSASTALSTYTGSISGSTQAEALKNYFNNNKASIPRNKLISFYSSAYSNGSLGFGYFLAGYDTTPYGGFFFSRYGTPSYVGITSGSFVESTILTTSNYTSSLDGRYVNVTGDTMTGLLTINRSNLDPAIRLNLSGTAKGCYGWLSTMGVYMYSYEVGKYISIKSDGNAYFGTTSANYKIWHAGNDGSGSGLDADLLDGYQGSEYLRSFWTNSPGYNANNTGNSSFVTFTYSNNAPRTGILVDLCTRGYGVQFNTAYSGDHPLFYRRHGISGDGGIGAWQQLARITDNVASATNADTVDGQHASAFSYKSWWHWSGKSGQPSWIWGGNSENNYYVYNPSNFSVNYATYSGSLSNNTSTDANTLYRNPGFAAWSVWSTYSNTPTNSYTNGINLNSSDTNYGWLLAKPAFVDRPYYRGRLAGSFTSWKGIAFTSEIPTVTNYYWANIKVSASSSTSTSPTFSTTYTSNWYRSTGQTGWYSETYGGGIYMVDTTYVRTYNSKSFYVSNTGDYAMYTAGGFASARTSGNILTTYYNNTWYGSIKTYGNGNLSLLAPGGNIYLAYDRGLAYFGGETYYINRSGYFNGTAAVANKLGTTTVGSSDKPIYLNAGVPTVCSYSFKGAYNQPIVLLSGYIHRTSVSSSAWYFVGSKHFSVSSMNSSITISGGVAVFKFTAVSGYSLSFTSACVNHRTSGEATSGTSGSYTNIRSDGLYWFGTYVTGSTLYVRNMRNANENNDSTASVSDLWKSASGGVLSFSVIITGYCY